MRKTPRLLLLLSILIALCLSLAGCGEDGVEVVFMVDGVEYQRIATDGETAIALPSDPVKDGYEFVGWFLGAERIDEESLAEYSGEITVTASFVPHVHTEEIVKGYAATCTETGLTDGMKCTRCGEFTVAQETIAAKGHTEETIPGYAATCEKDGLTDGAKCLVCDEPTKAQEVIKAKGHTEEAVAGYAATCTVDGLTDGVKCTVCHTFTTAQEVIKAKGHTEETIPGYAATCTVDGLSDGVKCTVCHTFTTAQGPIKAKGHTEETIPGYAATCTVDGLSDGVKCTVCQDVLVTQTVIRARGHETERVYGKSATCTESGLTAGEQCTVCKEFTVPQDVIPAKGHTEVTIYGKEATCTQEGKTNGKSCSVCYTLTVRQEVIPALGHERVTLKGYDATCTKKGLTDGVKCTRCNTVLQRQTQINAKGHTEAVLPGYAATCTKNGKTDGVACSVCSEVITAGTTIKANGHTKERGYCTACHVRLPSEGLAFELRDGGYYVTGLGTCKDTEIIIPEEHMGTAVVGIADNAFDNSYNYYSHITYVDIPDNVTHIGQYAFYSCDNLVDIRLSEELTHIGRSAFSACTSLTDIEIAAPLTAIPMRLFSFCTSLKRVVLPESVTAIDGYAFYGCTQLTDINLTASITTLGDYAFYNCASLTSIDLSGITALPVFGFYGCTSLYDVTFSEALTSIGGAAFCLCEALTEIRLPDTLREIGGTAFYECTGLSGSVTIPEGVTTLGTSIFWGCTGITEIRYNAVAPTCEEYVFSGVGDPSVGVKVIIGKEVTVITKRMFAKGSYNNIAPNIVSLEFEADSKCTEIQDSAFYGCVTLKTATLPPSLKAIGNSAFADCTAMTYLYFSNTADWYDWDNRKTPVAENAFTNLGKNADELTVVIGKDTLFIHNNIFRETGITEVIFEEGSLCTQIGGLAFAYCYSLKSITYGESIKTVGSRAFERCTALTAVHVRDLAAFCGINYTQYTEYTDIVREVGSNPLYYAKTLYYNGAPVTELVIPSGVTKIGCGALFGCTSITSVTIPASVVEIGNFAFYGCTGLKSASFAVTSGWYEHDSAEDTTKGSQIFLPKKVGNTIIPNHRVLNELYTYYYWKRY